MARSIIPTPGEGIQFVVDDTSLSSSITKNSDNIVLNAFRIAINGASTVFNMIDGFVDYYVDESGVDTGASINQVYDSAGDFYKPSGGIAVSDDPYAHYKCNDDAANTTVTDDGTGSNNGTAFVNTENLSVVGKINEAFDFNGTNEFINIDALQGNIETDTTGSICFWMNVNSIGATETLFGLWDTSSDQDVARIRLRSGGQIGFAIITAGTAKVQFRSTTLLSASTYYHIAVVQNGTEVKLYIDGVEDTVVFEATADKGAWFDDLVAGNIDNGRIGAQDNNGAGQSLWFGGKIDDFRYHQNYALSAEDVTSIYNEGNGTEVQNPAGPVDNMTLISESVVAVAEAGNARIVILEEDVNAITLNTDLKAFASKDTGSTWAEITLSDEGDFDSNKRILVGNADLTASGIGSGTNMRYKLETSNERQLNIHATSLSWD